MNAQVKPEPVSPTSVVRATPPTPAVAARQAVSGGDAHRLPSPSPASSPARFDVASSKGMFGWATLEGNASIPYLMRNDGKYVSVRMVERKLLSRYPRVYPPELRDRPPLVSQYASEMEANLLNEINEKHCEYAYGRDKFTAGSDLLVRLTDFEEFHKLVRRNFPERAASLEDDAAKQVDGGWIQVNNTVVPFVVRAGDRLAPLSVLHHAAGLLTRVQVPTAMQTTAEHDKLNSSCRQAGLSFEFASHTRLVRLTDVQQLCPEVVITELSSTDPFGSANYQQLHTVPQQQQSTQPAWVGQHLYGQPNDTLLPAAVSTSMQNSNMHPSQQVQQTRNAPCYRGAVQQQQSRPVTATAASTVSSVTSHLMAARMQVGQVHRGPLRMLSSGTGSAPTTSELAYALNTRAQLPALPHASPSVQPVSFRQESIACLYRDVGGTRECFALMEALARVYFPDANMSAVTDTLQGVLGIPLHDLTAPEEAAFIRFYRLQASTLRYRKIVMLRLFDFYFPQLHYIFNGNGRDKNQLVQKAPTPNVTAVAKVVKQEVTTESEVTPIVVEPASRKRRRDDGEVICID